MYQGIANQEFQKDYEWHNSLIWYHSWKCLSKDRISSWKRIYKLRNHWEISLKFIGWNWISETIWEIWRL